MSLKVNGAGWACAGDDCGAGSGDGCGSCIGCVAGGFAVSCCKYAESGTCKYAGSRGSGAVTSRDCAAQSHVLDRFPHSFMY